eukprot:g12948.t1
MEYVNDLLKGSLSAQRIFQERLKWASASPEMKAALVLVDSRSFNLADDQGNVIRALVPLIDLLNTFVPLTSTGSWNCWFRGNLQEGALLQAECPITEGSELVHCYSDFSSPELWATYGFLPLEAMESSHEAPLISLPLGELKLISQAKKILQPRHWLDERTLAFEIPWDAEDGGPLFTVLNCMANGLEPHVLLGSANMEPYIGFPADVRDFQPTPAAVPSRPSRRSRAEISKSTVVSGLSAFGFAQLRACQLRRRANPSDLEKEAARIRAEALALEEEQKQQRRETRALEWADGRKSVPVADLRRKLAKEEKPEALLIRVAKGRRPNTLRKHVKTWMKAARWMDAAFNCKWPASPEQFAEFLEAMVEEPCARSFPESIYKTLMFLEHAGEVPEQDQICRSAAVKNALEEASHRLQAIEQKTAKRQAALLPVAVIVAWEDHALDESASNYSRIYAWSTEINFRRLRAVATALADEDAEFLDEVAAKGVMLGVDEEMPRNPAVYEEKLRWTVDQTEEDFHDILAENYVSAVENSADIARQVNEEVEKGTILRFTEEEAKRRFGGRLAQGPNIAQAIAAASVRASGGHLQKEAFIRALQSARSAFSTSLDASAALLECSSESMPTLRVKLSDLVKPRPGPKQPKHASPIQCARPTLVSLSAKSFSEVDDQPPSSGAALEDQSIIEWATRRFLSSLRANEARYSERKPRAHFSSGAHSKGFKQVFTVCVENFRQNHLVQSGRATRATAQVCLSSNALHENQLKLLELCELGGRPVQIQVASRAADVALCDALFVLPDTMPSGAELWLKPSSSLVEILPNSREPTRPFIENVALLTGAKRFTLGSSSTQVLKESFNVD